MNKKETIYRSIRTFALPVQVCGSLMESWSILNASSVYFLSITNNYYKTWFFKKLDLDYGYRSKMVGHGNGFVTTEPKFMYLKSPGVKFMNYFTDLKNPLLKSFGSYKVEWVKWWSFTIFTFKSKCHRVIIWQIPIKILYLVWNKI